MCSNHSRDCRYKLAWFIPHQTQHFKERWHSSRGGESNHDLPFAPRHSFHFPVKFFIWHSSQFAGTKQSRNYFNPPNISKPCPTFHYHTSSLATETKLQHFHFPNGKRGMNTSNHGPYLKVSNEKISGNLFVFGLWLRAGNFHDANKNFSAISGPALILESYQKIFRQQFKRF